MRTTILALAALAVSGCTAEMPTVRPGPPARHVVVGRLPDQPLHDVEPATIGLSPAGEVDRSDPVAVAIGRIAEGLIAQGLDLVDLGIETTARADARVTVRVTATHRTGPAATPYTSVYELDLIRGRDGRWSVTGARTVG